MTFKLTICTLFSRKDEKDKDEEEVQPKFEWQRKWGTAPRESYLKGQDGIQDQPFGIQVNDIKLISHSLLFDFMMSCPPSPSRYGM